jgi:hypothetical protein
VYIISKETNIIASNSNKKKRKLNVHDLFYKQEIRGQVLTLGSISV